MVDGSFAGVLSDACACVDGQILLARVRDDPACDGELAELVAWAEDQSVRALLAAACSLQDQKSADIVISKALHDFLDLFMEGIGIIPKIKRR